jgi:hypothetical protein
MVKAARANPAACFYAGRQGDYYTLGGRGRGRERGLEGDNRLVGWLWIAERPRRGVSALADTEIGLDRVEGFSVNDRVKMRFQKVFFAISQSPAHEQTS